jgi:hypothetical protein
VAQTGLETFKLSELRLDEENYRLGKQTGQRETILAMINDQKGLLANLAHDIVQMKGLSPGEPIWVTKDPKHKGQYIVLEGNRRITAIKLMDTPSLADGTVVEKHFKNLSVPFAKKPIREFEAKVFASRSEAQPWIRRRHLSEASGVGRQRWKVLAKARADRAHGVEAPRFLAVIELLGNDTPQWNALYDALDARWTTVDRLLNAKAMVDVLGISIDPKKGTVKFENGDTAAGRKLLLRILSELASDDFEFADIEKVDDRTAFLERFSEWSVKKKAKATSQQSSGAKATSSGASSTASTTSKTSTASTTTSRRRPAADQDKRATLAPKTGSRTFRVEETRLQSIYSECKNIKLTKNKNAAALLLRVFIELSSEAILIKKKVALPAKYAGKKWSDINVRLDIKITSVLHYFDPGKTEKEFKQARLALDPSSQNAVYSIHTLHSYFHNLGVLPDPAALRAAWDAWEGYLRIVHENLRQP